MAKSIRLMPVIRESRTPSVAKVAPTLMIHCHCPNPAPASAVTRGALDRESAAGPARSNAEMATAA